MPSESLTLVEKALLRGQWSTQIPDSSTPAVALAKQVVECRYSDVLRSPTARALFRPVSDDLERPFQDLLDLGMPPEGDAEEEELARLVLAVACLHAFVQANWTGPDLDIEPLDVLTQDPKSASGSWTAEALHAKAVAELAYGGEPAYHLALVPAFLRFAQLLLALPYQHLQSIPWWRLRVATVHQHILDEPAAMSDDFRTALEPLMTTFACEPDLAGRIYLELGLLEHTLAQDKVAGEDFLKASKATGMEFELTGALGKRTKFQETELSQLVLLAESHLDDPSAGEKPSSTKTENAITPAADTTNIPETLALNDDTLLEQTEFTSSRPTDTGSRLSHIDPSSQPPLHPLDQCILLSLCLNVRNTQPAHGLTGEQMSPYVQRVISHPRNWSVHTMALLLRARLEAGRTRTVERSTFQLQALIEQMPTADSALSERLLYVHAIPLPSRWEMERELAQRFLSLGVVKSALEIFERLEMWEDVVQCYGALERPKRGIAIVRDLLEGRKEEADTVLARGKSSTSTPRRKLQDTTREAKLWCLLGDLDPAHAAEHYQRAWTISGETSGRAMRSLGGYHFARGQYADAIVCLRRAVAISPLLTRTWFILGCACMRVEDWEGAKAAFSRCVAIDEEDGESWNNLASMYLRTGVPKKTRGAIKAEEEDEEAPASTKVTTTDVEEQQLVDLTPAVPFENKMLAFRALKQGLRFAYENWRMWYNYMIVAMDVGELQEACRALGRVVEQTQGKLAAAVDEDVVDRLVDAVTRTHPDHAQAAQEAGVGGGGDAVQNPNEGHGLYKNVRGLLERTLLPRLSRPRLFRAYARLLSWRGAWGDAVQAHMDAYRCGPAAGLEPGGGADVGQWREAVGEVEELVDVLRNFGPRVEEGKGKWRVQARSVVRTFMGRTREFEDEPEWARLVALLDELRKVEDE